MSVTTLTVTIAGSTYNVLGGSFKLTSNIDETSSCSFTVRDDSSAFAFQKGQQVTVSDTLQGTLFTGFVKSSKITKVPGNNTTRFHAVSCIDNHFLADKRTTNKVYTNQYAGVVVAGMTNDVLAAEGVTANYAIREDNTQTKFGQGTLSGTVATSNLGGDLELASAGSTVTITESTTSNFGTGTLNNVTAASNSLAPTSFKALKMQCKQTGLAITNSYSYMKIWQPAGTFTVVSTRYLYYTIWIDPTSPEAKFGVDILFTDGTKLRDDFDTATGKEFSQNKLSPHPGTDLQGYATEGAWYGRTFSLEWAAGKNIQHIMLVCEGDKAGTYTAWFGPIMYLNADFTLNQYFFNTSLNVNPPQQMQRTGFASTSVTVVDAYDCSSANRVSASNSISGAGILKDSFITWKETLPEKTDLTVEYSINGGNSYIECQNNAALPSLPAGLSLSGKSIQFRETFTQSKGASPESKPILSYLQLVISPSYSATKSDVTYSATTTTEWNSSTTHTNTQASNNILQLIGSQRYFDDNQSNNEMSGITLYGGSASGPGLTNTCQHWIEAKCYRLTVFNNLEARGRCDFAGQFADGVCEFDVDVDNTSMGVGCVYRTTNWSNYDNRHAYIIEVQGSTLRFGRGSNAGDGSAGSFTSIATATIPFTSQMSHRYKIEFTGSSHKISVDDILYVTATDGAFTAAGYFGFRIRNFDVNNAYIGRYDNFGIVKSLTGNWLGTSTSLTGAGTYLGSVVTWKEVSLDEDSTDVLVESTINGGSSYQTVTNGGAIPNLTPGQSLSGISVRFRITLTTATATSMPQVEYFVARILGGFSSTGTRISPILSLASALVAGATVVNWSAITPTNTTVVVATSPDASTWTNVSNGGSIAGITGQPLATLDTFAANTSANYTATNRTGGAAGTWVWDTTNSRLTVSGGTNALLLYTSISVKDIDDTVDMYLADCAGLVWRQTDASNFYELDVFDSASNAGATNVLKLYKVVANTKTQLGSNTAIVFTRNTPYRVRVTMIGTAITVYFDGNSVLSTTDSALAGPGKSGLIKVSGSAVFYNLRIQPQGDNLSGKNAYTRVTLTSTDPTVTPQLTNLVLAALHPNITLGALIPTASYLFTYVSNNMDDLAKKSNTYWHIDQSLNMLFATYQSVPAPWVLTDKDILVDGLQE